MGETKTKERSELSFDGFGINGPDEYRTRLCTFRRDLPEVAEKYGPMFEAAPELLKAAKRMDALMDSLWKSVPWGKTWDLDVQALNEVPPALKRAIARAERRQS